MSTHFQQMLAQSVDRPSASRLTARQINGHIVAVGCQECLATAQGEHQDMRGVVQHQGQLADPRGARRRQADIGQSPNSRAVEKRLRATIRPRRRRIVDQPDFSPKHVARRVTAPGKTRRDQDRLEARRSISYAALGRPARSITDQLTAGHGSLNCQKATPPQRGGSPRRRSGRRTTFRRASPRHSAVIAALPLPLAHRLHLLDAAGTPRSPLAALSPGCAAWPRWQRQGQALSPSKGRRPAPRSATTSRPGPYAWPSAGRSVKPGDRAGNISATVAAGQACSPNSLMNGASGRPDRSTAQNRARHPIDGCLPRRARRESMGEQDPLPQHPCECRNGKRSRRG